MLDHEWTVYLVTDTGREIPHWTSATRKRAREIAAALRNDNPHLTRVFVKKGR